ncbi:PQQ-binding-like beta-propeller repeat protein [Nodosilinea sp. LEGE 07088]|uniref:PQQ-binding-like beta-propeller repeat protein n=1 Tax=Nodosilinea sp. LEGE 07088 TaxID=2777968 RepID=UPI00187E72A2|nr:PQQ-binding-like beta-propeller repeat protein [Nodosilinea sp. LEGE 07088]MBE9137982.1 PQQ-binding-like beta-propeller repeat protein [Nodosilinea sp. LEGE 07088]
MFRANLQRTGSQDIDITVNAISGYQWRLNDFKLASSDKTIVFESGYLYCLATRIDAMFASFYQIDAEEGKINWSLKINQPIFGASDYFSSPVIVDELAYFLYQPMLQNLRPALFCINLSRREFQFSLDIFELIDSNFENTFADSWKFMTRSSVTIVDGSIYIGTINGCICCFEAETGIFQWKLALSSDYGIGYLAYSNGLVFAESGGGEVYAIDIFSKSINWKLNFSEFRKSTYNWDVCPIVANGNVYSFSRDKTLSAIDMQTGRLNWQYSVSGQSYCSHFVASGEMLIGKMADFQIHAVDLNSGKKVWSIDIGQPMPPKSPPLVSGTVLFTSCGGHFLGIDTASSKIIFKWEIPFRFEKFLDVEYLVTQSLNLAEKVTSGRPKLSYISSPCITKDSIFIATENAADLALFKLGI